MTDIKLNIIINEQYSCFFRNVANIALDNNGIIFGGYVRDKIISDHYSRKYNQKYHEYNPESYWNPEILPEYKARQLLPKDIDVFFEHENDITRFLKKLRTDDMIVLIKNELNPIAYAGTLSFVYKKVISVSCYIGKTLNCSGIKLEIDIDILTTKVKNLYIEPPFYNSDFLCNIFVLNKEGIKISKSTGTFIDRLDFYNKTLVSAKIIKDMVNFKTHLTVIKKNKMGECILVERIIKMLNKTNPWTIYNLPFNLLTYEDFKKNQTDEDSSCDTCVICQQEFKDDDEIFNMKKMINIYHRKCMFDYLKFKINDIKSNKDIQKDIQLECPCKNKLCFTKTKTLYYKDLIPDE